MKQSMKFIVIRETPTQSFLTDIFTFGSIIFTLYVNYKWLGNHGSVAFLLGIMCIMTVHVKTSKKVHKFGKKQEAIDFINTK